MPFLIDGNNLMFALAGAGVAVGRAGLCRLLGELAAGNVRLSADLAGEPATAGRQHVRVILDGSQSKNPLSPDLDERVEAVFSGLRTADEVIAEFIAADTAPHRLVVVSSDHEVRQAARRRRCVGVTSEDFARALVRGLRRPKAAPPPEPGEKTAGLTPEQSAQWMRELGLADADLTDKATGDSADSPAAGLDDDLSASPSGGPADAPASDLPSDWADDLRRFEAGLRELEDDLSDPAKGRNPSPPR